MNQIIATAPVRAIKHVTGTRRAMERIRDLDSRLHGLPRKGHYRGGGRHAPIDDVPPNGWTLRQHDVRRHPSRDEWAYPIDAELARLRAEQADSLDGGEQAAIDTALAAAAELTSDWFDELIP